MFKVIRDYMIFYKIHMAEKEILDDLGSEQKWTKQLWSNKIMFGVTMRQCGWILSV